MILSQTTSCASNFCEEKAIEIIAKIESKKQTSDT